MSDPTLRIHRDRGRPPNAQFGRTLISVRLGLGLPESVDLLREELLGYTDILLGRVPSPIESPYLALQEVATAFHARAREIEMLIHLAEHEGAVLRGSEFYKFRTGPLQSFIEMSKRLADLGSRRMSQESLLYQQRLEGGPR